MTDSLAQRVEDVGLVLFDSTLWTDDEMLLARLDGKTELRTGHVSVNGPNGTLAALRGLGVRRKITAAHQELEPDPAG
jgi:pyrroloquinoline quinone biosynthesis protein B